MARLRTVFPNSPGWTRRRVGRSFSYVDQHGDKLTPEHVARIKALVIPPAWETVWICPYANGHIQAVGTDAAGRKQYLYHPDWRTKRDKLKFDRVREAARLLPAARKSITRDLALDGMPLPRADAVAVRLLDRGYFRIGSDIYADTHGSFGLTTLEKRHVRLEDDKLVFEFVGKSGVEHKVEIQDEELVEAIRRLQRRRGGSTRLLAYQELKDWLDLDAAAVNLYLSELLGGELTAKDFRTWHATVIAAAALSTTDEPGDTKASRKRAIRAAVIEVAEFLGNTPTIARNSYIDPRVIDLYEDGTTIDPDIGTRYRSPTRRQEAMEEAVLELLED